MCIIIKFLKVYYFDFVLILLNLTFQTYAQFDSQTYPDPRTDPFTCRIPFPGQICDPSEVLNLEERFHLVNKLNALQQLVSNITNTSPACTNKQKIYFLIALIERINSLPYEYNSIERFATQLRLKYLNYQDANLCDTLVLIVNSKKDQQVFTVAGKDLKLSRQALQNAFQQNVKYFQTKNNARGLEGIINVLPSDPDLTKKNFVPGSIYGVKQKLDSKFTSSDLEKFNISSVPKEDQLWVKIIMKVVNLCGHNFDKISHYVQAYVEEAMSLSLELISDSRYNKIEEDLQNINKNVDVKNEAWQLAKTTFIDKLYKKYSDQFSRNADSCPKSIDKCIIF